MVLLSLQATSTFLFDISLGIQPADISEGGKNLLACNTWTPHGRTAMRSKCLLISLYREHLLICEVNYTIINGDICQAFLRKGGQAAGSSENWHMALQNKTQNPRRNILISNWALYYEAVLYLHCTDICLGYQNWDFSLQQLQSEHSSVRARHCAEPFRDITL